MSRAALRYDLMTGQGVSACTVSVASDLEVNAVRPGLAWVELPPEHPAIQGPARWRVQSGAVLQKTMVTFMLDVPTFPADGAAEARITAVGLTASAILDFGGGLTAVLTPADPVVVITSDIPRRFMGQVLDALHWSERVTTEAL